jgi:hypothetical protein
MIGSARSRLARIAATGAAIRALAPALTALALALALAPLNGWTRLRFGSELAPAVLAELRVALAAVGVIGLALAATLVARAARRAGNFVSAAERVDTIVNARQEILTLATLTDPSLPAVPCRPQLFPILWRRVTEYLANFSPTRAFRFNLGRPIALGSAWSLAIVVVFGFAMMALVRPPSPEAAQARELREMARELENSPTGEGRALAKALRDAADALENNQLPPERKLKMLADVTHDLDRLKPPPPPQSGKPSDKSGQNSGGKGSSGQNGAGSGNGTGNGAGPGTGNGKNTNAGASGSGPGKKNNQQIADLQNELAKAKEQIEKDSAPNGNSIPKPAPGDKPGNAQTPGQNPNQPGAANRPDAAAQNNAPKPGQSGSPQDKSGPGGDQTANNDKGSDKGDTRLGQFPAPVRYDRFYKPGEKGPPIELRDARYVVFRLPSAPSSSGGGKTVLDTERPEASAPYSNAPLKAEQLEATPDERQLVPPRYRDLIQ